jgi:hypothetical protein
MGTLLAYIESGVCLQITLLLIADKKSLSSKIEI